MRQTVYNFTFLEKIPRKDYGEGMKVYNNTAPVAITKDYESNQTQRMVEIFQKLMPDQPITVMNVQIPGHLLRMLVADNLNENDAKLLAAFEVVQSGWVDIGGYV